MINKSLNDSAPVLVLTKHQVVVTNFRDKPFEGFRILILPHVHEDLLDYVVSVEIYWAFKNIVTLVELCQHLLFLLNSEDLEASLNHSAPVLVSWQLQNISPNFVENDFMIPLFFSSVQLYPLNHIIPILIFNQFVKIEIWILEKFVKKLCLFI